MMIRKGIITAEDLYAYAWISDPSVNSQSGTIAYIFKTVDKENNSYRSNVRLVELDGCNDRSFTEGDKDELPIWSPCGKKLAFLRPGAEGKQIWIKPWQGGDAIQLTSAKYGVETFVWSPDGLRIAYTARTQAEAEKISGIGKSNEQTITGKSFSRTSPRAEGSGWWDGRYTHLFVIEAEGTHTQQLTYGDIVASQPFWSPDGEELAYLAKIVDDPVLDPDLLIFCDIYKINISDGKIVKLTDSSLFISQASYSPKGDTIDFIANERAYGSATHNNLYTIKTSGGLPAIINSQLDMQIGNVVLSDMKSFGTSPAPLYGSVSDESPMYVIGSLHGNAHVYRFSRKGSYEAVTSGDRDVYQLAISADGRYIIAASTDAASPGELYRIDTVTKKELRLTAWNDQIMREKEVSTPQSFWFTTADEWELQGWLMKPSLMESGEKYPMLLHIHGGPHALYGNSYSHEFQALAAKGYGILFINPRGSFGYGQHFAQACRGDFGGRDYEDLLDAVDYVLSHYNFIDENRLGVCGGSYGGFLTSWIVGQNDRFRAAVTERSISNWLSFFGTSDIGISYTEGEIEGNPWEDAEKLWARSPLAYVKNIQTPLLILHGEQDLRCPIGQAEELYTALKRLGKETEFVRFPKSNHALPRNGIPSLRLERLKRTSDWFDRYL